MGNPRAINWWMDGEMWYIHTTEYYPVIKRKEILTRDTKFMYLEVVMLSESSQTQKATYYDFTYMQYSEYVNLETE